MKFNKKVLLLGNIKEDGSTSMHRYLQSLLTYAADDFKFKIITPSIKNKYLRFLYKNLIYPIKAAQQKSDIYHIIDPSYGSLAMFLPSNKLVINCYDLIPIALKGATTVLGKIIYTFNINWLKKAAYITTSSENTKKDIIKYLGIKKEKIVVNYLGIDDCFRRFPQKRRDSLREKNLLNNKIILLSVGSVVYKNTISILKAVNELKDKYDIYLYKIGAFSKSEENFISKNDLKSRIYQKRFVSNKELVEIYNMCDILVFPSLYEGFGIPPLEAMKCGCPVISSNAASLPEVVGDAALLINPYSINELKRAIVNIIEDADLKRDCIKKGLINAKKFIWKNHINKIKKIYGAL